MTSCAPGGELPDAMIDRRHATNDELLLASHDLGKGLRQTDLSVPTIHCGGCIQKIEKTLDALPGVEQARVNLSARRVTIRWRADGTPPPLIESLRRIGYEAHLYDADADSKDGTVAKLVRALAVAGFAASNIMLLSVSIWSGAKPATRDLFHWISALIALPAVAYSGRIFFGSAWQSLRHGETNMDVPISIGVLLAFGLSLYETFNRGPHAYFDASITLLFFLLIGRTLDHMMRERARVAVKGLARLAARGALIVRPDGSQIYVPLSEIKAGMTILLTAGERVPVNGRVLKGQSDIDCSLVSGESIPQRACAGSLLQAGTLNLTGSLTIAATAAAKDSFLAEMIQMMEAAEFRTLEVPAHFRPRVPALRSRGSRDCRGDICRLGGCHRGRPPGAYCCRRGSDHYMPLRARPRRSDGAGRCSAALVREGHHDQGWRCARASRRRRHRRLRQDRHPHAWRATACRRRRDRYRRA